MRFAQLIWAACLATVISVPSCRGAWIKRQYDAPTLELNISDIKDQMTNSIESEIFADTDEDIIAEYEEPEDNDILSPSFEVEDRRPRPDEHIMTTEPSISQMVEAVKTDCRRVKFTSEDPQIDIVVAVDTNVGDCLEEINEENEGTEINESIKNRPVKTHDITVYKNDYWKGTSIVLTLTQGKCQNVPSGWNDEISSIDLSGACVIVYQHADCNGNSARLRPESVFVSEQLHRIRMNDDITSLELC